MLERFDNAPAKVALKHLYIANPCKSNSQTSLSENVLMIIIQYVDRKKNINMMNFQQVAATKVQDGPRGFRAHSSSCGPLTSYAEAPHARHPLERPRTPSGWMSEKMGLADFSWCNLYSIQYKAMSGCQLSVAVFYQNLHFTRSRGVSRKIPSGYGRPDATILENPTVH